MNLFVQGGMGYHEKIPENIMANKNMKIQGTPYSWFADSTVLDRINKIAGKLGVEGNKSLPKEFNDLGKFSFEDLSRWTNMEAKYQLASLLAHPKSSIANLYGGTVHTLVSTGWDNFSKARKIKYLQTHVNPKWQSMADVEDWVKSHGVIEEFLLYEADINPKMKGKKWSGCVAEAMEKIKDLSLNISSKGAVDVPGKGILERPLYSAGKAFLGGYFGVDSPYYDAFYDSMDEQMGQIVAEEDPFGPDFLYYGFDEEHVIPEIMRDRYGDDIYNEAIAIADQIGREAQIKELETVLKSKTGEDYNDLIRILNSLGR